MKRSIVAALVLLAGCAGPSPAQRQAAQARFWQTMPKCFSDRECEIKWAAARNYVIQNATLKIQNYSSDYIETYGSGDYASTAVSMRVVKNPLNGGGYQIQASAGCKNLFGCDRDIPMLLQSFNDRVNMSFDSSAALAK